MRVPFLDLAAMHRPLAERFQEAWDSTLATSGFIGGRHVDDFERRWSEYCETSEAIGVANGTDALRITLAALGVGPGDEVIVPTNTFVATVAAVKAVGATPRLVDVDAETLLLTPEGVAEALNERTAAVMPVHLYGQPVDMPEIMDVAHRAGIAVIEDAAQAHGARWEGRRVGSFGHAACFSFYPGKNLGAFGDAGAVVTNDPQLARRIRQLSNHGRGDSHHVHEVAGDNSRLDALQAAVLDIKLDHLDEWNAARRAIARHYQELLADLPVRPVAQRPEAESVYHLFVVQVDARDDVLSSLEQQGVGVGLHYPIPCHLQPAFESGISPRLPVAEHAAQHILSLPMFPHMTREQTEYVGAAIARAVETSQGTLTA
ncbi:MAG TPA: DegT/DnrJ/EryC1/StrS family aminotransferase [Acidimicrobiia bacterium]|nr:DegT/DnrJ/EryC1/StrS family aminotransferase [Acidimicrobiia bacterium]